MKFELIINNKGKLQMPSVIEGVTWATERRGSPGKLTFTVVKDEKLDFTEGNPVRLTVDDAKIFYGFIFEQKRDKQQHISVMAYDQIRYLLNKDTYAYTNKKASDVIQMIASDYKLQVGEIEQTSYNIPQMMEDNKTLLDIVYNALDRELAYKKHMFVFYDDFRQLTLKPLDSMKVDLLIDEETGENFSYSSTIDDQTYNRVKLSYENKDTKKREIYVMQDPNNIDKWGILQYYDTLQKGENGDAKASALLSLYNAKTRKLKITKTFGDVRVRAGCLVVVKLTLGDININTYMLVEKCTHKFSESEHRMDLTLKGGGFNG